MPNESQSTEQERADRKKKNLDAFKKHSEHIGSMLENHKPATELIFDEGGQPDILFQGQKFYDGKYYEIVEEQIGKFKKDPSRFNLAIPQPNELDEYGMAFLSKLLQRASIEEQIEFRQFRRNLESYFAVVQGIGLAGHIDGIVEFSKCKSLILMDPNIETLYHSLEIYDWAGLFERQIENNGRVEFILRNDANNVYESFRYNIRGTNAPGVDGTHICTHYNNTMFSEVQSLIEKNGNLLLAGLGFFNDERMMIENTHQNIAGGAHIYVQQEAGNISVPCFIVGCGPSLDQDLPYIKEHANNAVVFSSGSALGPLLNAGVTPDFQIEVENIGILPIMEHVAKEHDISKICLVTSTTVEPEIVKFFDRIVYHFRPALAPYGIFSDNPKNTIPNHDPSVVNSSFGFAQDAGFREFYMFGCDMGTRDPDMHHAKNSYHFTDGAELPDNDFCIPVTANFGGMTRTSRGLYWVKDSLEAAISQKRAGRSYYNCTDGAFINGTIAKFAKKVDLPKIADADFKKNFVESIIEHSPVMSDKRFAELWQDDAIQEAMDDIVHRLKNVFEKAEFVTDMDYQSDINKIVFYSDTAMKRGIATLFRGTIHMALLAAEFYSKRVNNDEDIDKFESILREELLELCDILHDNATDLVESLARD